MSFDLDVRCVVCGGERMLHERAERVLEAGAVLFVETTEPCECGARRVRVEVKIDAEEDVTEGGA